MSSLFSSQEAMRGSNWGAQEGTGLGLTLKTDIESPEQLINYWVHGGGKGILQMTKWALPL